MHNFIKKMTLLCLRKFNSDATDYVQSTQPTQTTQTNLYTVCYRRIRRHISFFITPIILSSLIACGGGGGSSDTTPPQNPGGDGPGGGGGGGGATPAPASPASAAATPLGFTSLRVTWDSVPEAKCYEVYASRNSAAAITATDLNTPVISCVARLAAAATPPATTPPPPTTTTSTVSLAATETPPGSILVATVRPPATSYTATGLSPNTEYTYSIKACNESSCSNSAASSAATSGNKNGGDTIINSAAELNAIRADSSTLAGNYILAANIDLSDIPNWQPIGDSANGFTGSFDGSGYEISGMTISGYEYAGLFGYVHGASISNLGVNVNNINSSSTHAYAGGLAAHANRSFISNVYVIVASDITSYAESSSYAGGLFGRVDNSRISNSYVVVRGSIYSSVSEPSASSYAEGLVGYADSSSISNSYYSARRASSQGDFTDTTDTNGVAKTVAQLRALTAESTDWDKDTWYFGTANDLPKLSSDFVPDVEPPPVNVPASPRGVTVAPLNSTSIRVSWNSVSDVKFYRLYDNRGGAVINIAPPATSYTATDLLPNTGYTYRVAACNDSGCSAFTSRSAATPIPIPASPSSISAAGQDFTSVTITWSKVLGTKRYEVYNGAAKVATLDESRTTYIINKDLLPATEYIYSVKACNDVGCSDSTEIDFFTPSIDISSAPQVTVVDSTIGQANPSLDISWNYISGVTSYQIFDAAENKVATVQSPTTNHIIAGLTAGTLYEYKVRGCYTPSVTAPGAPGSTEICGDFSAAGSATTPVAIPATPSGVTAAVQGLTSIRISWDSVVGATSYEVYNGDVQVATIDDPATSYTVSGLLPATEYTYSVKACNLSGCSDSASAATTRTPVAIPATPSGVTAAVQGLTSIIISWNSVDGATSYEVYKGDVKVATIDAPTTRHTATGLLPSTEYIYSVKACNTSGCSVAASAATTRTPVAIPDSSSSISTGSLNLTARSITWRAVSGATSYEVYKGDEKVDAIDAPTTSYTATALLPNTEYTYSVKACNISGCSVSTEVTFTTEPIGVSSTLEVTVVTSTIGQANPSLMVSWDGITGVTSYQIFDAAGNADENKVATVPAPKTSHIIAGLTAGTLYEYRVRGCYTPSAPGSSEVCGDFSAVDSATTPVAIPAVPSNVAAAVQGLTSIRISWDSVDGAEYYEVHNGNVLVANNTHPNTSYTATDLLPATEYTYKVKACNLSGCSDSASAATTPTPVAIPAVPSNVAAAVQGLTSISISWDSVEGATSYEVHNGDELVTTINNPSTTSYTVSDLSPATEYTYSVKACNLSGCSDSASTATTTPVAIPDSPSSISAAGQDFISISITWRAVSGATSYEVYKGDVKVDTINAPTTRHTATDLLPNTEYTYGVKACNTSGCSDSTEVDFFSPPIGISSAPEVTVVASTIGQANPSLMLSWGYIRVVTSYQIFDAAGNADENKVATVPDSKTSHIITDLSAGTLYEYRVRGCYTPSAPGSTEICGDFSAVGSATTPVAIPDSSGGVTIGSLGFTSISITWGEVSGATSYQVHNNDEIVKTIKNPETTIYTATDLSPNKEYTYSVKACNTSGCSVVGEITATTKAIGVSSAPRITAVASTIGQATPSLNVSWDHISGVTSYQIFDAAENTAENKVATVPTSKTSHIIADLSAGALYTYKVRGCYTPSAPGSTEICGDFSPAGSTTTPVVIPDSPSSISAGSLSLTARSITWRAVSGATSYEVYKGDEKVATINALTTSYTATALLPNTGYTYSVKACNPSGCSVSTEVSFTTDPIDVSSAPQVTVVTSTIGQANPSLNVSWDRISGVTSYQIFDANENKVATVPTPATSHIITDLSAGTLYEYKVRGCYTSSAPASPPGSTEICGDFSAVGSVTTPIAIPATPGNVAAVSLGFTSIRISWDSVEGAEYYEVRNSEGGLVANTTQPNTSYTATDLLPATEYTYNVKACNTSGCSSTDSATTITNGNKVGGTTSISSAAELAAIRANSNTLSGDYNLTGNIDLSDISNWQPIGDEDNKFTGSFDGNGYNISGVSSSGYQFAGLFGYVENANISNVGVLVGNISSSLSSSYLGGLVGRVANSPISNSYAVVGGSISSPSFYTGGLVGDAYNSPISNSYAVVEGSISLSSSFYTGGLVGSADNSPISDSYAVVEGNISSSAYSESYLGGLAGYADNSPISNSYAEIGGSISSSSLYSSSFTGGLVGRAENNNPISNSYAVVGGSISSSAPEFASYSGGLVGRAENNNPISNSYALVGGSILSSALSYSASYSGGLVGWTKNSPISNSYAVVEGSISSEDYSGGLVGNALNSPTNNSYAVVEGNISSFASDSYSYSGGLIGKASSSPISNSYVVVIGSISSSSSLFSYAGGLVGSADNKSPISYSYHSTSRKPSEGGFSNYYSAPRTPAQLRRLTAAATTWDGVVWDFGTDANLPTLRSLPSPFASRSPASPGDVTATASGLSAISISWGSVVGATSYEVYNSSALVTAVSHLATSYAATDLLPATKYTYRVRACNVFGCSDFASASATTDSTVGTSSAPQVTLVASTIGRANPSLMLSWDSIAGVTSYQIVNRAGEEVATVPALSTEYIVVGLAAGTLYEYQVRGCYDSGVSASPPESSEICGELSEVGSATTSRFIPSAPSGVTATALGITSLSISWNSVEGALTYQVHNSGGLVATIDAPTTSYTTRDLLPNTEYTYSVKACDGSSCSASVSASATTENGITISSAAELAAIRTDSTSLAGDYALTGNIDLSHIPNWQPIGNFTNKFTGSFNGNGYNISRVSSSGYVFAGLFGYVSSASISNVGVLIGSISSTSPSGYSISGGLVGRADYSPISNSYVVVEGSISSSSSSYSISGGLVGYPVDSPIINSYAVVGGSISSSSSSDNSYSGGLVGYADRNSPTNNSYAVVGGIISSSSSSRSSHSGGLVGYASNSPISNSYAVVGGSISSSSFSSSHSGGLVGRADNNSPISKSYYSASRKPSEGGFTNTLGTSQKLAELRALTAEVTTWDENIWDFGTAANLPILRSLTSPAVTAIPGDVTATALSLSSISMSWSSVVGATSYEVYNSEGLVGSTSHPTTNYAATNLLPDTQYTYRVRACNLFSCSDFASDVSATTDSTIGTSSAPQVTLVASTIGRIMPSLKVSWDSIAGVTSYQIVNRAGEEVATVSTPSTEYVVAGLAAGALYEYQVRGCYDSGVSASPPESSEICGELSPVGSATTSRFIPAPSGVTATALGITSLSISWNSVEGATSYQVHNSGGLVATIEAPTTSYTTRDLLPNKRYTYSVKACNVSGCSASVSASATTEDGMTISSAAELEAIRASSNALAGNYALTGNIDLSHISNWQPIGDFTNKFTGSFDGNGYRISGINSADYEVAGLFGYIEDANISNVGVLVGNISSSSSSDSYSGGLVGFASGSPISNSYALVEGSISSSSSSSSSDSYSGGLVGYASSSPISNSYAVVKGDISSSAFDSYSGGLVGYASSSPISNSYAVVEGSISSSSAFDSYSGGLVGRADANSPIRNSYVVVEGSISSSTRSYSSSYSGGLVGSAVSSPISNSYAEVGGSISSLDDSPFFVVSYSGGLVGSAVSSPISNSYAVVGGSISSFSLAHDSYSGGLVGIADNSPISNSYAVVKGDISSLSGGSSSSNSGGLVGGAGNDSDISNSYYSARRKSSEGAFGNTNGTSQKLAELRALTADATGWDAGIWDFGTAANLPTLRSLTSLANLGDVTATALSLSSISMSWSNVVGATSYEVYNSDGLVTTIDAPATSYTATGLLPEMEYTYRVRACNLFGCSAFASASAMTMVASISSAADLAAIHTNSNTLAGDYALTGNIDLSDISNWQPIGDGTNAFTGSFNGNGYNISGVSSSGYQYTGLFGYVENASISNVGVVVGSLSSSSSGNSYSGGLVGSAYNSPISNSYAVVEGSISSSSSSSSRVSYLYSGGLVGSAYNSPISKSYALVGGSISSSYSFSFSFSFSPNTYSGGLVGGAYYSPISNSYAVVGSISSTSLDLSSSSSSYSGGLVGHADNQNPISNSYAVVEGSISSLLYSSSSSPNTYSGGLVGRVDGSSVTNSYYNASRESSEGGFDNSHGTSQTVAQLRALTADATGWDEGIWDFGTAANLPILRSLPSPAVTTIPGDFTATALGPTSISISWDSVVGATSYEVYNSEGLVVSTSHSTTNYAATNLLPDTQYTYRVRACNLFGCSAFVSASTITRATSVSSAAELATIRTNSATLSGYYALTGNIDLSHIPNWQPIGNETNRFTGNFNGNGYNISGVSSSGYQYAGLFGWVENADISNVGVLVGNISTSSYRSTYSGGLVGYASRSSISNSYAVVEGGISSFRSSFSYSGGLVGIAYNSPISNSYVVVGGSISSSSSSLSSLSYSGGLVGFTWGNQINNSYAVVEGGISSSSSSGSSYSGGLVGFAQGNPISNSYAVVEGGISSSSAFDSDSGGLVGGADDYSPISNSYYSTSHQSSEGTFTNTLGTSQTLAELRRLTADATGWDEVVWDFGTNNDLPTLRSSHSAGIVPPSDPDPDPDPDSNNGVGKETNRDTDGDGTPDHVDTDDDDDNYSDALDVDDDGDGLIEIATAEQLNQVRHNLLGSSLKASAGDAGADTGCGGLNGITECNGYELVADISLAGYNSNNWLPIGSCPTFTEANVCTDVSALFNTVFDGNGYTISNLTITNSIESYTNATGLFGAISPASQLRNIHIRSANLIGGANNVGVLVGYAARASIIDSSAVGEITAYGANVGGLVGYGWNTTIISSYAAGGNIVGVSGVGGLIGSGERATISSSYAAGGDVGGVLYIGGLVGSGNSVTISLSYAAGGHVVAGFAGGGGLVGSGENARVISSYAAGGNVSGFADIGGLIGSGENATITSSYAAGGAVLTAFGVGDGLVGSEGVTATDSYWDSDTTGVAAGIYGLPQTTRELQSPTSATGIYANWDDECDDGGDAWDFGTASQYPVLSCTPGGIDVQRQR